MNDADFASWSPGEAMLEDRSGLSFDWLEIEDDGESFAALRALSQAEKQALFAACVARTVKGQLAFEPQARPELEVTVARLDIDFASHVRPTADMLWSRINKGRILDIARSVLSPAWASRGRRTRSPTSPRRWNRPSRPAIRRSGSAPTCTRRRSPGCRPGFAAFDTGRVEDEPDDTAAAEPAPEADGPDAGTRCRTRRRCGERGDARRSTAHELRGREHRGAGGRRTPGRRTRRRQRQWQRQRSCHAGCSGDRFRRGDHGSDAGVDGPESGTAEPAKPEDIAARPSRTGERPRCRRRARHSRVPAPCTGAFRRQLTARHGPSCAPPDRRPAGRFRFRILRGDVPA